jgi:superkiller protein 3
MHKLEEDILSFDKAIESHPNDSEAYFQKGQVFFLLGKYEESIEAYDQAV